MSESPKNPLTKKRLAIVVSHPIQHFVHFYRAIHESGLIELKVFFCTDIGARRYFDRNMNQEIKWDIDLYSGYNSIVLPESSKINSTRMFEVNNPSIIRALKEFSPDVVKVHGYSQLTMLRTLLWCRLKKIPVMLWSDSSLKGRRAGYRKFLKSILLRMLFKQFDAFLSVGDNNTDYIKYYGVPPEKIFKVPFTIDEKLFDKAVQNREQVRLATRKKYDIPEKAFVFLFVGKLTSWKRPMDVVKASLQIIDSVEENRPVLVFFAGNGELREALENKIEKNGAPCKFGGFINVLELPAVYVASDTLVHAAETEPYGLVIKEAACAGLPVIVSDQTGALGEGDAAREGQNAISFTAGNIDQLANAMKQLYLDESRCKQMSLQSREITADINMQSSVTGICQAIQFATTLV